MVLHHLQDIVILLRHHAPTVFIEGRIHGVTHSVPTPDRSVCFSVTTGNIGDQQRCCLDGLSRSITVIGSAVSHGSGNTDLCFRIYQMTPGRIREFAIGGQLTGLYTESGSAVA